MTDVAVITGGASGFGRALAEGCAARRMNVVLLDLDGDRASTEAAALAAANGVKAFGLGVDVADGASVEAAAATVSERFGKAHLVISKVGVQLFASIYRATDDEWRWLLDVNVVGSARVARAFLPLLRRAERGRLALTSWRQFAIVTSGGALYGHLPNYWWSNAPGGVVAVYEGDLQLWIAFVAFSGPDCNLDGRIASLGAPPPLVRHWAGRRNHPRHGRSLLTRYRSHLL